MAAMCARMPFITTRVVMQSRRILYQAVHMEPLPEGGWAVTGVAHRYHPRKEEAEIIGRYWAQELGLEFKPQ